MKKYSFKIGTQKEVVYTYLSRGKTITTKEAIIKLGIADLQGVIRDLKREGVQIYSEDVKVPTRYIKSDGSVKMATVREYALEGLPDYGSAEDYAIWNNR